VVISVVVVLPTNSLPSLGRDPTRKVSELVSTSLPVRVMVVDCSSSTNTDCWSATGLSLEAVIVTATVAEAVRLPSVIV
jgi:hypothetical protein